MTAIQRKILRFMDENGGECLIGTGHRDTSFGRERSTGTPAITGSRVVLHGLISQKLIDSAAKWPTPRYRLTEKARAALARMKKGTNA